jgi:hypothetical protein
MGVCVETHGRDVYRTYARPGQLCVYKKSHLQVLSLFSSLSPVQLDSVCVFVLSANLGDLFKKETHVRGEKEQIRFWISADVSIRKFGNCIMRLWQMLTKIHRRTDW